VGLGPRVIDWAIVSCGGDEEACYHGRRFALLARAVVRFFRTKVQRATRMTCGPGPPCHRLGCLGARRARFSAVIEGRTVGFP
jgi:hypothetical protein